MNYDKLKLTNQRINKEAYNKRKTRIIRNYENNVIIERMVRLEKQQTNDNLDDIEKTNEKVTDELQLQHVPNNQLQSKWCQQMKKGYKRMDQEDGKEEPNNKVKDKHERTKL